MPKTRETGRETLARMLSEKMTAIIGDPVIFTAAKVYLTHGSARRGVDSDRYSWTAMSRVYSVDCYETMTECIRFGFTVHHGDRDPPAQFEATAGTKEHRK